MDELAGRVSHVVGPVRGEVVLDDPDALARVAGPDHLQGGDHVVGPLAEVPAPEELVSPHVIDPEEVRHPVGLAVVGPDASRTAASATSPARLWG